MLTKTVLSLAVLGLATASPLVRRQSATTCGSNRYTAGQVSSASSRACQLVEDGDTAGSSKYPERYNDYEGFDFGGDPGPYYEFPILESGTYNGGSPGADRVVVSTSGGCGWVGTITHSGASNNDFLGCSGTS